MAHVRQVEMQNTVRAVRKQEGTLKEEVLTEEEEL